MDYSSRFNTKIGYVRKKLIFNDSPLKKTIRVKIFYDLQFVFFFKLMDYITQNIIKNEQQCRRISQ